MILQKMNKKFLIITEGEVTEPNFLVPLFQKYGLRVLHTKQIDVKINDETTIFTEYQSKMYDKDIIIAQGPRNRIRDLMKLFKNNSYDLERFFEKSSELFAGIFLIYDVDQTLNDVLEESFNKFNNEQDGLLLISSPCIEVLAHENDFPLTEIKGKHLSKIYKPRIKEYINNKYQCSLQDYLINNFEKNALKYLEQNVNDFNCKNVMEHPGLVISKVNLINKRTLLEDNIVEVNYRYFTTVIYVCLAYITGLTKEIDNSDILKEVLENHK